MTVQYPRKRETAEQEAERLQKHKEENEEQGFDEQGRFLDKSIKKLNPQELRKLRF